MKTIKTMIVFFFLLFLLGSVKVSFAGPYADDLSRCIVESTTTEDRIALVKWIFIAFGFHPAVKKMVMVSKDQLEEANKQTAELYMKLLTETCKEKAQKALKYEGQIAIVTSFQVLMQVAGQEMFSNPEVADGVSGFEKYINKEKLETSLGIKMPK
jgi:hypothetical protein